MPPTPLNLQGFKPPRKTCCVGFQTCERCDATITGLPIHPLAALQSRTRQTACAHTALTRTLTTELRWMSNARSLRLSTPDAILDVVATAAGNFDHNFGRLSCQRTFSRWMRETLLTASARLRGWMAILLTQPISTRIVQNTSCVRGLS